MTDYDLCQVLSVIETISLIIKKKNPRWQSTYLYHIFLQNGPCYTRQLQTYKDIVICYFYRAKIGKTRKPRAVLKNSSDSWDENYSLLPWQNFYCLWKFPACDTSLLSFVLVFQMISKSLEIDWSKNNERKNIKGSYWREVDYRDYILLHDC